MFEGGAGGLAIEEKRNREKEKGKKNFVFTTAVPSAVTHRKVFLVLAHNKKRKVLRKRKESPPKKAIHNVKKNIQISMKKKARKNYHNEPSPEWTNNKPLLLLLLFSLL